MTGTPETLGLWAGNGLSHLDFSTVIALSQGLSTSHRQFATPPTPGSDGPCIQGD